MSVNWLFPGGNDIKSLNQNKSIHCFLRESLCTWKTQHLDSSDVLRDLLVLHSDTSSFSSCKLASFNGDQTLTSTIFSLTTTMLRSIQSLYVLLSHEPKSSLWPMRPTWFDPCLSLQVHTTLSSPCALLLHLRANTSPALTSDPSPILSHD